ncbi:hypothetical protein ACFRFC_26240, partial [Streptomyces sp. NPDC056734]
ERDSTAEPIGQGEPVQRADSSKRAEVRREADPVEQDEPIPQGEADAARTTGTAGLESADAGTGPEDADADAGPGDADADAGPGDADADAASESGGTPVAALADATPDADRPRATDHPAAGSGDAAPDAGQPTTGPDVGPDADRRPTARQPATTPGGVAAHTGQPAAIPEGPAPHSDHPATTPGHTPAPSHPQAAPHPAPDHPHSNPPPRPTRRRSPLLVASVVAAVLLVGGGGAYLATSADKGARSARDAEVPAGGVSGGGTPPPLALDGYAGDSGIAPGEPDPGGGLYRAVGELPQGPADAPVYTVHGDIGADDVTRLADALGIAGTPVAEGPSWRIGGQDGQGPSLSVSRQGPGTWTFHQYVPGPDGCQSATTCAEPPDGPAGAVDGTGDPVGEAEARALAAPVLRALGQDDAEVDASQVMGAQRMVNAEPQVDGLPTHGRPTQLTIGTQGELLGGSGQLSPPVEAATYPVLGAEETLGLLNATSGDGRVGIGGCADPVPLEGRTVSPCEPSTTLPETGAQESMSVEGAEFGLASHTVGGRPALVPSWLFEVRGAGAVESFTVTHPAVDPAYLAAPSPTAPPAATESASPPPGGTVETRDVQVEGYTAEGQELTVRFTGGVCADYSVAAQESGGEVRVTVTETPWPDKTCILIAEIKHQTVLLDEPLGDRKVVGSDGAAVALEKPGARLPG